MQLSGRLLEGKLLDSSYNAGVFTGTGTNERNNDDAQPMWVVRYQWNLLGREVGFTQSDIEGKKKPHASLAGGFVSNRQPLHELLRVGRRRAPGIRGGRPGDSSPSANGWRTRRSTTGASPSSTNSIGSGSTTTPREH